MLVLLLLVTMLTGVAASLAGLTEFWPHRAASLALLAAAALHVWFHRGRLVAQLRRLCGDA